MKRTIWETGTYSTLFIGISGVAIKVTQALPEPFGSSRGPQTGVSQTLSRKKKDCIHVSV